MSTHSVNGSLLSLLQGDGYWDEEEEDVKPKVRKPSRPKKLKTPRYTKKNEDGTVVQKQGFKCDLCEKSYRYLGSLRNHMKVRTTFVF